MEHDEHMADEQVMSLDEAKQCLRKYWTVETEDAINVVLEAIRELAEYRELMAAAYTIELTDWELVLEKYGSFDSPTGIVWCVQTENEEKLSRHFSALDAWREVKDANK